MNRNRLIIRLGLICLLLVLFFSRRNRMSPDAMKGFAAAIIFGAVITIVRVVLDARKKKALEQDRQAAAGTKDVELFSKPKDL